ncbi:MAG: type II toxin-antitoxin system HicA family toxin [Anaerolineae bacterium]|nr:type II toxin-antitoxin system HicA family toxin [Anaerolineae bacterium]
MSKTPSLSFTQIIKALQRDGWVVVRQRGSHIRLQKRIGDEVLKITVPAHRPVKRSTLAHILKQARLEIEEFRQLL